MKWRDHPDFPFVEVRKGLLKLVGEQTPGRREYTRTGSHADFQDWYERVVKELGPLVSHTHVAPLVGVSTQAVDQAVADGRLTEFGFDIKKRSWRARWAKVYALIPLDEVLAWARIKSDG